MPLHNFRHRQPVANSQALLDEPSGEIFEGRHFTSNKGYMSGSLKSLAI